MRAAQARTIVKILGGIVAAVAVLGVAGWLAFVPSAQEPGYEFVKAWGGAGTGPGELNDPTGVAVAGGEVFVADSRNGRIQVFDLDGQFKRAFGKPGEGVGELGRPMNLTVRNGELYVPEYFNDRIQVFALDGTPKRIIDRPVESGNGFNAPGGVAVAGNGDLFVVDFYNHRVLHLGADGSFVRQWGATGEAGSGGGEFSYPTDAALGADGTLYVADGYADRVQAFAPDGGLLSKWGGPFAMDIFGPFNGWFKVATSIATGPEGNVFVADFYNDRVQKFAPAGTFLTAFGEAGDGPGQFRHAIAVDVAADGAVLVADFLNNRIQKWRPQTPRR